MMQYSFPTENYATHATDLLPLFMNNWEDAYQIIITGDPDFNKTYAKLLAKDLQSYIETPYQAYLGAFAVSGNPNSGTATRPLTWPIATPGDDGDELKNVVRVQQGILARSSFVLAPDPQNTKSICTFWTTIANQLIADAKQTSHS